MNDAFFGDPYGAGAFGSGNFDGALPPALHGDYRPGLEEVSTYETLFGDLLAAGHTVAESADFLISLGNGHVNDTPGYDGGTDYRISA